MNREGGGGGLGLGWQLLIGWSKEALWRRADTKLMHTRQTEEQVQVVCGRSQLVYSQGRKTSVAIAE